MTETLKPCPFCGGDANPCYIISKIGPTEYGVSCVLCGTRKGYYSSAEIAADIWNTRSMPEEQFDAVLGEFKRRLPGWWFNVGACSLSRHASCGPDREGPDRSLLPGIGNNGSRVFDDGFHADLTDPAATIADALRDVMEQAIVAKEAFAEAYGIDAERDSEDKNNV